MNSHDGRSDRSSAKCQVMVSGTLNLKTLKKGGPGGPAKIEGILTPVQPRTNGSMDDADLGKIRVADNTGIFADFAFFLGEN